MKRDLDIPIILVFLFIFVFGIYALFSTKVSLLPPHSEPVITIMTEYREMEPDLIEESVTRPIESLLKEVKGIKSFFSYSSRGRSKIVVFLNERENVDEKAIFIKDKIYHVADQFPEEVREPALYKYNTDESPVMILSLSPRGGLGDRVGEDGDFDAFVEQRLKPELLSVEGVANVETAGARREEIFIEQRYEDLVRLEGDCEAIFGEIVKGSLQVPLGSIEYGNERVTLSFPNRYADFSLLVKNRLPSKGIPIRGGDVLDVRREKRAEERLSFVNNAPTLTLYVFKKDVSNILEIGRGVRKALSRRRDALTCGTLYDQAEGFRALLTRLGVAASLSIVCVFVFISLFYRSAASASLAVLTVSSSFTGAVSFLLLLGRSMNIMSLSGIIVGIGPCMGNGIILLDEIARLRRESVNRGDPLVAVRNALRPVAASTFALVVLFLPLFMMSGELNSLNADFALAVSAMLTMSSFVTLLFLPALMRAFGIDPFPAGRPAGDRLAGLRKLLLFSRAGFNRGPLVLVLFAGAAAGATFFFINRGYEDVSPLREDAFELYFEFDPEYNADYKRKALLAIGEEIMATGMPVTMVSKLEDTRATFFLKFPAGYGRLRRDADRLKDRLSGVRRGDGFFTFQTGKEAGVKSVLLYFFGDRQEGLEEAVDGAAEACFGLAGVTQVLKGYRKGKTELVFTVEPSRMYSVDMNVSDVIRFLRYVFYFPVILKHYNGEEIVDVRGKVAVDGVTRENIRSLRVSSAKGEYVALGDFATLTYSEGAPVITRKNGKRFISLDLRYENTGDDALAKFIRSRLRGMKLGGDIYYEFDEKHLEARRTRALFMFSLALALFLSYVVLGTATNSFSWPLTIILIIPSCLIGSTIFLAAGGYERSVPVHIGLIMLTGLALTGPLLLVDELLRTGKGKGAASSRALLFRACENKLRLFTAASLTPVVSLVPVVVLMRSTGFFEVLMGLVLSGEVSSFLLSLIVFPAVFSRFARVGRPIKTGKKRSGA